MKHLVLLLLTLNILLAKDYAVQVLAVENSNSITPYFSRIAKSMESDAVKMKVIEERTKNYNSPLKKVLFEKFEDKKSAMKFCKTARTKLFGDAFVREINAASKSVVKEQVKSQSVVVKEAPQKTFKRKAVKKYVSTREKRKMARKREIAEAIAFYKNSSGIKYTCSSSF